MVFKGSFTFYALEPGCKYEVRVQAKNEEGWSERGRPFMFSTPEFDMEETFVRGHPSNGGRWWGGGLAMVLMVGGGLLT